MSDDINVKKSILKDVLSFYYGFNSDSHGYKHIDEVFELSIKIKEKLNLDISDNLILIASYCHDMFSSLNREQHHELAYRYILNTNIYFLNELDEQERYLVACAVREHRASYTGEYTSILSEIISAADRGIPNEKKNIIRAYQFASEKYLKYDINGKLLKESELLKSINRTDSIVTAIQHTKEKFGSNGYARYNKIYLDYFGEELERFKLFFDNLTMTTALEIINEYENLKKGER